MTKEEKIHEILKRLYKLYPHPKTALEHTNALQLLIATILSAQATDKTVNTITPELFKKYKTAEDFANAPVAELEQYINKVNFYHNKAKSIQAASKIISEKYHGRVPETMQELDDLPGVARKTANVVLGQSFHKAEGIVVDTHVMRLSQKLGLTTQKTPEKIEEDLTKIVPKENWIDFPLLLINYGREYCPARPHDESKCPLHDLYDQK